MKNNISHQEYVNATIRLEEIIDLVDDSTPKTNPLSIEFINISHIIEAYEQIHFPIGLPSLKEVIELRMFEMKLKQKDLAVLLNISASRVSEIFKGKRDITLNIAKSLHKKLNIDSDIILQ